MTVPVLRSSLAGKAVWGRAILVVVLAMLFLAASPAEANERSKGKSVSASQPAARAARVARRHAKLDVH